MRRVHLLALAAAGGLALAADPAFAAVGTSAQVNNNASAAIATSLAGLPGVTDTHGQSVTGQAAGVLGGFVPAAFATVGDTTPGAHNSVQASQNVTAEWINPNHGTIAVGSDWEVRAFENVPNLTMQATTIDQTLSHTAPTWQYAFDATGGDNLFSMDFSVGIIGDAFGRGAWDFNVAEDGHQLRFATLSDGAITGGHFEQALETGHSYVLTLTSNDGITIFPNGRTTQHFQANAGSQFDWTITGAATRPGVPEPSTWALSIVGFGLAGAALRRAPHRRPSLHRTA